AGDIALDSANNAYVAGATSSLAFPTSPGAFQPNFNGVPACFAVNDGYVIKLNTTPSTCTPGVIHGTPVNCVQSFVYGTYLGGSLNDVPTGIAVDTARNAYVTGFT